MNTVTVTVDKYSYPIIICSNFEEKHVSFYPLKKGNRVCIVTNNTIASLHLNTLDEQLNKRGIIVDHIILNDGESTKSLQTVDTIFTKLLSNNYGRDSIIIAFGGGVIGDLTGFVASIYQRGIRFIQIPTTLLAQVDASIGGKTGVNHTLGKNMIGSFYQPSSVIINLKFLNTLPKRELYSGLAEVIKYGIILDKHFFDWIEKNITNILSLDPIALKYCVLNCCKIKSEIVSIDEKENNLRSLLNLGHTYGHAIETYMNYKNWSHGEAVAAGIIMSTNLSVLLNKCNKMDQKRIRDLIKRANLPISGPSIMSINDYLYNMMRDKKVINGKLRIVLPIEIGKAELFYIEEDSIKLSIINN